VQFFALLQYVLAPARTYLPGLCTLLLQGLFNQFSATLKDMNGGQVGEMNNLTSTCLGHSLMTVLTRRCSQASCFCVCLLHLQNIPLWQKAAAGLAAGGLGALVGTPADLTLIRMQADSTLPLEQRRNYKASLRLVLMLLLYVWLTDQTEHSCFGPPPEGGLL
jgi:hypothetical protein